MNRSKFTWQAVATPATLSLPTGGVGLLPTQGARRSGGPHRPGAGNPVSTTPSASPSPSPRPDLAPFGAVLCIAEDVIVQERA